MANFLIYISLAVTGTRYRISQPPGSDPPEFIPGLRNVSGWNSWRGYIFGNFRVVREWFLCYIRFGKATVSEVNANLVYCCKYCLERRIVREDKTEIPLANVRNILNNFDSIGPIPHSKYGKYFRTYQLFSISIVKSTTKINKSDEMKKIDVFIISFIFLWTSCFIFMLFPWNFLFPLYFLFAYSLWQWHFVWIF